MSSDEMEKMMQGRRGKVGRGWDYRMVGAERGPPRKGKG